MIKVCHIIMGHDRNDPRVFKKQCSSLSRAGYDVTLLCADGKPDETVNGVKIISVKQVPNGRLEQFFKSVKFFYSEAVKIDADVYHIHEPGLLDLAKKLKKLGKKVIFDSHEDTPKDIKSKKYIPFGFKRLASVLYAAKEKKIVKKLDAVISVSYAIVERLKKINHNAYLVTNYPEYTEYETSNYMDKPAAVCFAGIGNDEFNLSTVAEAIEGLDIRFNMALRSYDEGLRKKLQAMPVYEKITVLENIPFATVVEEIYKQSTIGVAIMDYNEKYSGKTGTLGITKFFEYMMMGLPVICTDFVLWKEIIEECNCGLTLEPRNKEQIKNAVEYLMTHKEEAMKMGENGKQAVKTKYNWEEQKKVLLSLYQSLEKKECNL